MLIAPIGTPAAIRIAPTPRSVFVRNASCSASTSARRFALRAALVDEARIVGEVREPERGQNTRHSLSLPMPIAISRVLVRNV